jgi:co-chaperonin GroES (HSP10)
MSPAMLMSHEEDPAKVIFKKIGSLKDITIFGNQVLLGVYERPQKTKSGILLADQTRGEDKHQGKAGLVLKKGPFAFVSDAHYDFKGQDVEIGDWVAIWVSDGRQIVVNGVLCRIVEDQYIRLKIPAPDIVF